MTTATLDASLPTSAAHPSASAAYAAPALISKPALWTGRILTGVVSAFLLLDATVKLVQAGPAVEGTLELGYPTSVVVPLGVLLLACLALHLIPRTAVLGAVLLTGYLGGAIATHVRVGNPLATHVLFPVYVGVLIWAGLYLRDLRVRALLAGPRRSGLR